MTQTKLIAFHGDPAIKRRYLSRVHRHRLADEIIHGKYWEDGKGCGVGCTIHSDNHAAYETELGIPAQIAHLEDNIFEGLPNGESKLFPKKFLKAIKPGAGLSLVVPGFVVWSGLDEKEGIINLVKDDEEREICAVGRWVVSTDYLWRCGNTRRMGGCLQPGRGMGMGMGSGGMGMGMGMGTRTQILDTPIRETPGVTGIRSGLGYLAPHLSLLPYHVPQFPSPRVYPPVTGPGPTRLPGLGVRQEVRRKTPHENVPFQSPPQFHGNRICQSENVYPKGYHAFPVLRNLVPGSLFLGYNMAVLERGRQTWSTRSPSATRHSVQKNRSI